MEAVNVSLYKEGTSSGQEEGEADHAWWVALVYSAVVVFSAARKPAESGLVWEVFVEEVQMPSDLSMHCDSPVPSRHMAMFCSANHTAGARISHHLLLPLPGHSHIG